MQSSWTLLMRVRVLNAKRAVSYTYGLDAYDSNDQTHFGHCSHDLELAVLEQSGI
jgi:hypothetical protein